MALSMEKRFNPFILAVQYKMTDLLLLHKQHKQMITNITAVTPIETIIAAITPDDTVR